MPDLSVQLNRLRLPNPILVASGTFGYAREMQAFADFSKLGGIIPKTVTPLPRPGNPPPRTVETSSGLLNSIGLDNDGLDAFIEKHVTALLGLGAPLIVNIAGKNTAEFAAMATRLSEFPTIAALELNISCPNVSDNIDFSQNPKLAAEVVSAVRAACPFPVIAKLTPNVTSVPEIAQAAADGGADAVSLVNTFQGLAIDWKKRQPILGNGIGGLSGPAIKPLALRIVWQVAQKVKIPIIGIGGVLRWEHAGEFILAGATAIEVGTGLFADPKSPLKIAKGLERWVERQQVGTISALIGAAKIDT